MFQWKLGVKFETKCPANVQEWQDIYLRLRCAFANMQISNSPGGILKKVLYGRPPLGVEPLTFLYTIYWEKLYPFRIPFIDKWQYPLHKSSLEHYIPFNYCKRTFFLNGLKIELKSKRQLQRLIKQRQKGWGMQYFDWPIPGIGKPGEDWYWPGRRLWGGLRWLRN